jgi:hypothetical protein
MFIVPWQSRPNLDRVVGLIFYVIAAPIILTVLFFILLIWLSGYLTKRLTGLVASRSSNVNSGDMRVPTSYSLQSKRTDERAGVALLLMSITGVVFGGIHYPGWLFIFPSSANQAFLWRVSSGFLTGVAFLFNHIFHISHVANVLTHFKLERPLAFGAVLLVFIFVLS